jgi:glycosyltransferase involved in cell wall biosynthesis
MTARLRDDVCVIIPARDSAGTLPAAVASVTRQDPAVPIVVAVGPSADSTAEVAAGLAAANLSLRLVDNPGGSTPAALNRALAGCDRPVVVRLDAHAQLPDGYLDVVHDVLTAHPEVGNVGGRQVPLADGGFAAAVAAAMGSPFGAGGAAYRTGTTAGPTDTVYLGAFRRSALEEVGGFDERMIRNQDYELNIRLREAGWTIWFEPRLAVAYRPRGRLRDLARQYFEYGRYRRLTARLHPGTMRPRQLAAPLLVLGLVAAGALGPVVAWWVPGVLVVAYGASLLLAGVIADARRAVAVALALATMHLSWGVGFLLGPPR